MSLENSPNNLSLSEKALGKMVNYAGKTLEKRYPGQKTYLQMLKSPDVMFPLSVAMGLLALVTPSIEVGSWVYCKLPSQC